MTTKPEILIDKTLTEVTPEILAELFWNMYSEDQAKFYNHLDTIANFHFPFQLQAITEDDGLPLAGRRVMKQIGDYSHWGITCKSIKESTKHDKQS